MKKRFLSMLVLLVAVVSGAWAQEPATYKITLAEGTEDADKWTISPNPAPAGAPVTATYSGDKKVKSVKAVKKAAPKPDLLAGEFSVSASKKVKFSKGNLSYASSKWSFFDNQYDYYNSYSADAWDHFGWSTSATDYGMNTSTDNATYSGDFVDWGATMGDGWRTLTNDEWTYLFDTRTSGSIVFGTENGRYAQATINTDGTGVNGMILFPDGVTIASTEVTTAGTVNAASTYATKCTSAQWTALETKGCVFLPAAGQRDGSSVNDAGSNGRYWSGTAYSTSSAYRAYAFNPGNLYPADGSYRYRGYSVRLVQAVDPLAVPMTIEAITAGTISVSNPKNGMQYSKNGGAKTAVTTSIDVAAGDKVQFYGNGTSITSYNGTKITGSGDDFTCKVYGNIMSLVDEENFATATTLSANYTFRALFNNNTTLTDASGLLLPATQLALATSCYYSMFEGCSALTAAPELPATTLVNECYYYMFKDCTALTTAPALPATQLASYCYYSMFEGCTALTTAPALPATQLAGRCYYSMFQGCSALTAAPVLPATQLVTRCYQQMFMGCSKLATITCLATSGINSGNSTTEWLKNAGSQAAGTKTVYTSSSASWPMNNNNGIPSGWEHENIDN